MLRLQQLRSLLARQCRRLLRATIRQRPLRTTHPAEPVATYYVPEPVTTYYAPVTTEPRTCAGHRLLRSCDGVFASGRSGLLVWISGLLSPRIVWPRNRPLMLANADFHPLESAETKYWQNHLSETRTLGSRFILGWRRTQGRAIFITAHVHSDEIRAHLLNSKTFLSIAA